MHINQSGEQILATDSVFPFKFLLGNFCLLAFTCEHLIQPGAEDVC